MLAAESAIALADSVLEAQKGIRFMMQRTEATAYATHSTQQSQSHMHSKVEREKERERNTDVPHLSLLGKTFG